MFSCWPVFPIPSSLSYFLGYDLQPAEVLGVHSYLSKDGTLDILIRWEGVLAELMLPGKPLLLFVLLTLRTRWHLP